MGGVRRRLTWCVSELEGVDARTHAARTFGFIQKRRINEDEKRRWLKRIEELPGSATLEVGWKRTMVFLSGSI